MTTHEVAALPRSALGTILKLRGLSAFNVVKVLVEVVAVAIEEAEIVLL
jgi:hypothetical protein